MLIAALLTLVCVGCSEAPSTRADSKAADTRSADTKARNLADIKALEGRFMAAFKAKDVKAIVAFYVPDESLFVFDVTPPRQYVGTQAYTKDWEALL
jgi:hypothetical protein